MKKATQCAAALGLCGVLAAGVAGVAATVEAYGDTSGTAADEAAVVAEDSSVAARADGGALASGDVTKRQVVYVKEDAQGDQEGVYVVNSFDAQSAESVTDSGDYETVTNLSDEQELSNEDAMTAFEVAAGETFRYQGNLSPDAQTPWKMAVSYRLDGQDVAPEDLAGASGKVEMHLAIEPNEACSGAYADNYLLQVTATIPDESTGGLQADGATVAQSGDDTQLTYMVFPGKSVEYAVSFEARDFSFDGFQMVGVPLSIALDVSDEDLEAASADLEALSDATARLNDGTSDVAQGVGTLDGGVSELVSSNEGLSEGAVALDGALAQLQAGSRQLSDSVDGQLAAGMQQLASGSSAYASQLDQAIAALEQRTQGTSADEAAALCEQALAAYAANPGDASRAAVENAQSLASAVSALEALESARSGYAQLDAGIQGMADEESSTSVFALARGAQELAEGVEAAKAGSAELRSGLDAYLGATASLDEGVGALRAGADELAAGAQELFKETRGIDRKLVDAVRSELEAYLNPSFQPVDFVNGSANVERVQFVYKTAGI